MPKRIYLIGFLLAHIICLLPRQTSAQCPGSYTMAQLNWDYMDYYYNSGVNVAPYGYGGGNYVTNAMEQTQKFAIGTNWLTLTTSAAGIVKGENALHTGNIAGYTGEDAQYTPTVNGQTITITFNTPVLNANFALYDIDLNAVINVTAADPAAGALVVTATPQIPTILTVIGVVGKTISDLTGTALGNASNQGTVTIAVAGTLANPVKSITITCTTIGTDAAFWMSDINACVTGSFPTNWHQGFSTRPFIGPTQNQPDYFLVTPDNKSVYYMDPATGKCYFLFSETSSHPYVNSLAYDPANKYLYYVTDGSTPSPQNNKTLKRYDYTTETFSSLVTNINSLPLNIPTFNVGVESGGGAFYNGKYYMGIEGGRYGTGGSTITRESIIYAIELDGSFNPNNAYQVFSINAYKNATDTAYNDWGDFIIKNGIIYNFNTARVGSPFKYPYSAYHHFDMMSGTETSYYKNTNLNIRYTGQSGMNWQGQLFFIRDSVGIYNENGTNGTQYRAVVQNVPGDPVPPAWAGNAGDATDPFRPKCDFGDAPATYDPYSDPSTQSPAVHERSELIRFGATWDRELWKKGTTGSNDTDDGISSTPILLAGSSSSYLVQVNVFNNSGANATVCGWLDYNGNGVFDVAEGVSTTVSSSASAQNVWLWWSSTSNTFTAGQTTYLRIRVTAASAAMTTSHPTGYFTNGEVEDYIVTADVSFPLSVTDLSFEATLINNRYSKLSWSGTEERNFAGYEVQKSANGVQWSSLGIVGSDGQAGFHTYEFTDENPYDEKTYYRLRLIGISGNDKYSKIKSVKKTDISDIVIVKPNPATTNFTVDINSIRNTQAKISVYADNGTEIFRSSVLLINGANSISVPVKPDWKPGNYIVRVTIDEEIITRKIVIQR